LASVGLGAASRLGRSPRSRRLDRLLCVAGALACAASALAPRTRTGRALIVFALAAALGCALVWWRAADVAAPRLERPVVASFTASIEAVEPLPAQGDVRCSYAPMPPPSSRDASASTSPTRIQKIDVAPGMTVKLRARLMPPAPMAVPGGYDFARTAWFRGIGATGRAFDPPVIVARAPPNGFWARLGVVRARLTAHVLSRIDGGEGRSPPPSSPATAAPCPKRTRKPCGAAACRTSCRSAGSMSLQWSGPPCC
jgi:competence protein ComEC